MSSAAESPARWRALALVAAAELLGMSLWFSASAVAPALKAEWGLTDSAAAWLTLAVQLGFVAGTLVSAFGNLPDVFATRRLFAVSAWLGAAANAGLALFARGPVSAVALRFLTGFFLAGVYPPGMKILATWFRRGRGAALGILVGGIALGKAFPYLVNAVGHSSWRVNVLAVSGFAVAGGAIVLVFVGDGPYATRGGALRRLADRKGLRATAACAWRTSATSATCGSSTRCGRGSPCSCARASPRHGARPSLAEGASFLVIGSGAIGCVAAGLLADRIGRTAVTSWAMGISGACCLFVGLLFDAPPGVLLVVAAVWGAAVVADSAQFSACVTELGDPQYMGTALTIQTCVGFLLTMVSIELVPLAVTAVGWRWAFAVLAPGPALGVVAMLRLRGLPEAAQIAHGRR